jgi:hypothetical protein
MSILHLIRQIFNFVKQQNGTTTGQSLFVEKTKDRDFSEGLGYASLTTLKLQTYKAYYRPESFIIQNAPGGSGVVFPRLSSSSDHCKFLTKAEIYNNIYGPHLRKI